MGLILACRDDNDLCAVLRQCGVDFQRFSSPEAAIGAAEAGAGVLLLADDYPERTTRIEPRLYDAAASKQLRLYIEFPEALPGMPVSEVRKPGWERAVVTSGAFEPAIARLRILMLHSCRFVDIAADNPHLVLARVAGFESAIYGLPEQSWPILLEHPDRCLLVAATKLSQFVTGRYAPTEAWQEIVRWIVTWACPGTDFPELHSVPSVRPSYGPDDRLPSNVEEDALQRGTAWFENARLFIHPEWQAEAARRLYEFTDGTGAGPDPDWPSGDGTCGMIEGASSRIHPDGTQDWRYHVRNDCTGEVSMAMAFAGENRIAAALNDFIYTHSIFAQGPRADPESPSYGLLSWTTQPPADGVYYGDDNARSMLGTMAAGALLDEDRWDQGLLRCLLANLRTTGPLGFRGWRLDEDKLQTQGWRTFWETERVHFAPHYESWLWACFLWAYDKTGFAPFLERPRTAIQMTMEAYPDDWRWTNGIQQERARMLLALAWLVRVDDTPEHRAWLRRMADELLAPQALCGAIREEVGSPGLGAYGPPESNEAYGTSEAPLIQQNGDPLCDLLYTTNFALVGLHEAAAATGETLYAGAEERLVDFLCRIQIRSEAHAELDGGWFRAFDFGRWDYWASNADEGWGAWSIESGWTQGWITAVLALRRRKTSLWELTSGSQVGKHLTAMLPVMLPEVTEP
jgi:hypothetical protein